MPDAKITALTAISVIDPAVDPLPIVDVSDTAMAASGTTKKITINQILGASGTATLASATITGNLTVQTNKLFVSASGAAVGTTSVFADFQVQRSTNARLEIDSAAASLSYQVLDNARTGYLQHNVYASQHLWFNGVTEAMRLNSTGLGVGVTPLAKLHVDGGGVQGRFSVASATDARHEYFRNSIREALIGWDANLFQILATQATGELAFGSGNTIRVRINSAGDMISNVTSIAPTLATNNQMVFNLTSNTNLRISVRGSDGVTRVANITLA